MPRLIVPIVLVLSLAPHIAVSQDLETYRKWVSDMQDAPRGPFERLRWFCNDGTVHPKPYPCEQRCGGHQHGEWSDETAELRAAGYKIANVFAGLDPAALSEQADFRDGRRAQRKPGGR